MCQFHCDDPSENLLKGVRDFYSLFQFINEYFLLIEKWFYFQNCKFKCHSITKLSVTLKQKKHIMLKI